MGEMEEKLNTILGDQAAMSQIMALAQSLGKSAPPPPTSNAEQPEEEDGWEWTEETRAAASSPQQSSGESPLDALSSLDPRLLQMGIQLWREYQGGDQKTDALLQALRPFLRKERQVRLDRAVQLARLSHVIRVALQTLGEGGEKRHV